MHSNYMDYLDPKKKKQKKVRLMLMYALLGVAIAIATVVMVYLVNGYTVDRQTGEVVQNSLLYLDTKPESAEIFINGEKQRGRTDARLVLPEGTYQIEMKRDGYHSWTRNLLLEGGSLRRLTYARLIPEELTSELGASVATTPTMVTQSNDKRWLVHSFADNPLLLRIVDLERPQLQTTDLQLPLDLLSTKNPGVWKVIDWADDDKTFLAQYTTADSVEFAIINRENGPLARNIQKVFPSTAFTQVDFRARKNDQLYLFDSLSGTVSRAIPSSGSVEVVLTDIKAFKSYDDDVLLYITEKDATEGMVAAYLKYGNNTLKLRELKKSDSGYLLDISKQGNALVMGVGSPVENRVVVYNDPINAVKQNDFSTLPVPTTVMRVDNPQKLSISADSSVIVVRGGQAMASHEFEADRSYSFTLDTALDAGSEVRWLDGQHISYGSGGKQFIMDFDGSNRHELVAGLSALGSFVDKDFEVFFTYLDPETAGGPSRLMATQLRAAVDR